MARQKNDGRGRIGGRQKGMPNKITCSLREWLQSLIDANREQLEQDLESLEPRERLQMIEKLLPYVLPKQQSLLRVDKLSDGDFDRLVEELTNKELEQYGD